jgi:hypothetical protein
MHGRDLKLFSSHKSRSLNFGLTFQAGQVKLARLNSATLGVLVPDSFFHISSKTSDALLPPPPIKAAG